jgi:hypothetical protein
MTRPKLVLILLTAFFSVTVFADGSKLFSGDLIEYKLIEQPGISLMYPHEWIVDQDLEKLRNGRQPSRSLSFKFFTKSDSGKKTEMHLGVSVSTVGMSNEIDPRKDFSYLFEKKIDGKRIVYSESRGTDRIRLLAAIVCDSGSLAVNYALSVEEESALKKTGQKLPMEFEEFISHIVCKKLTTKKN